MSISRTNIRWYPSLPRKSNIREYAAVSDDGASNRNPLIPICSSDRSLRCCDHHTNCEQYSTSLKIENLPSRPYVSDCCDIKITLQNGPEALFSWSYLDFWLRPNTPRSMKHFPSLNRLGVLWTPRSFSTSLFWLCVSSSLPAWYHPGTAGQKPTRLRLHVGKLENALMKVHQHFSNRVTRVNNLLTDNQVFGFDTRNILRIATNPTAPV